MSYITRNDVMTSKQARKRMDHKRAYAYDRMPTLADMPDTPHGWRVIDTTSDATSRYDADNAYTWCVDEAWDAYDYDRAHLLALVNTTGYASDMLRDIIDLTDE